MKRLLFLLLAIALLVCLTSCSGYNGIMREHLSNEENYHAIDATFCSYKKADGRIYLYVAVEDKSAFDFSESNSGEIRLEVVGSNCDIVNEIFEKDCIFKVDYDVVNKRIEEERKRGLDFLKMALEAVGRKA